MQRISKNQFDREGVSLVVFLRIAPELFRIGTCQEARFSQQNSSLLQFTHWTHFNSVALNYSSTVVQYLSLKGKLISGQKVHSISGQSDQSVSLPSIPEEQPRHSSVRCRVNSLTDLRKW